MNLFGKLLIIAIAAAYVGGSSAAEAGSAAAPLPPPTLIRNVRVFDGERLIARTSVLFDNGQIVAVGAQVHAPAGATIVEGAGNTLLPGLIDGHVHMSDSYRTAGALGQEQAAMYGITTTLEMGTSDPDTYQIYLKRLKAGDFPDAADMFTAGVPATAPGGHGDMLHKNPTLTAPDQADAWVAQRVATGSAYIKIMSETFAEHGRNVPTLSDATFAAVVTAAHRYHRLAVAHTLEQFRATKAVLAGIDVLAHISPYNPPDPDFGRLMKAHHVFQSTNMISYAPATYKQELAEDPDLRAEMPDYMVKGLENTRPFPDANHAYSIATFKLLVAAGVPIIAGTDIGYPYAPLLDAELAIMVHDGGLTPIEALQTATSNPARAYHLNDRGRIMAGRRADLVLVKGDPTRDIAALHHVLEVWIQGRRIDRAAILQQVMAAPVPVQMGPPPPPRPVAKPAGAPPS